MFALFYTKQYDFEDWERVFGETNKNIEIYLGDLTKMKELFDGAEDLLMHSIRVFHATTDKSLVDLVT